MRISYPSFIPFPKIPRLFKECVVTEKIDGTNAKIIAEKNDAISKMEWWKKEAERWRNQALDLDAQLESLVSKLTTRMSRIESSIQQIKEGY